MKKRTTEYVRQKGGSNKTVEFRQNIMKFLSDTQADHEIHYSIQNDLSKKIDHPFYGVKKAPIKVKRTPKETTILRKLQQITKRQIRSFLNPL